jgi:FG-GAP-like repeat
MKPACYPLVLFAALGSVLPWTASRADPSPRVDAGPADPGWSSDHSHRILVRVDPIEGIGRSSDELVARVEIDFDRYLGEGRCDLSTLEVIEYEPKTGEAVAYAGSPVSDSPSTRPLRVYDHDIPWEFPERQGYAQNNNGTGLPLIRLEGGGRFLPVIGEGRRVSLAWAHLQRGDKPTYYAIYFDELPPGADSRPAVPGFVGDGSNRCGRDAESFFPLYHSRVDVADLDADGLFDLVVGNMNGTILWYPNLGKAGKPAFSSARLVFTDEGDPLDIGYSSAPRVVDWDGDGDLDLIVGAEKESFVFFRNTGTAAVPKFHLEGLLNADGKPLRVPKAPSEEDPEGKVFAYDYYPVPDVVDWDGDGDLDLLAGGYITGRIWLYENVAEDPGGEPELTFRGALQADGADLDVTWMASPSAADFDGDGDLDLISGAMQITEGGGDKADPDKFLWYYENIGSRSSPKLTLRPFPAQGRFRNGALGTPRAIDFNGDGLLDLVVSASLDLLLIPNIGEPDAPLFDAGVTPLKAAWGNDPLRFQQLIDYDHDGWPDFFSGTRVQKAMPMFEAASVTLSAGSKVIPFVGPGESIRHLSPRGDQWEYRALSDLDGDGLLDILVGVHEGYVWFHRNKGTREQPRVDLQGERLKTENGELIRVGTPPTPEDGNEFDELQGARTTLCVSDFNRDGKADLVVCDTYGVIRLYLRAPGDSLVFEPPVVLGREVNIRLAAQPVDWDGDGWDDILATYAGEQTYLLVNRAGNSGAPFEEPRLLSLPRYPMSWPLLHVADWNNDGDRDILLHYGTMLRFIERSFVEHGYIPAAITAHERKPIR